MEAQILSKELDGRLKHKELYEDRLNAFERFNDPINKSINNSKSIKHGLGMRTDLEFMNYDSVFNEEGTNITINGKLWTEHSHRNINFFRLGEFLHNGNIDEEYKKYILNHIKNKYSKTNNNLAGLSGKLEDLHQTLSNIYILAFDDKYTPFKHVKVDRIITGNSYNHLIILVGNNSKMKIYLKTVRESKDDKEESSVNHHNTNNHNQHFTITDFTDIIVGVSSDVELVEHRSLTEKDVIYGRKNVLLDTNSTINWINIDQNSRLSIIEQHSSLNGNSSKSTMSNISCGKNSEYYIRNISEHNGENTESLIQNKCVLNNSKAVIKGLVKINKPAFKSNGYQKSDILILDDTSRAISVPDLEIHNHDVKCTHGSSITKLDKEKIFYLESRGINKKDAEQLLIDGFYDKVLSLISDEELREQIRHEIIDN